MYVIGMLSANNKCDTIVFIDVVLNHGCPKNNQHSSVAKNERYKGWMVGTKYSNVFLILSLNFKRPKKLLVIVHQSF